MTQLVTSYRDIINHYTFAGFQWFYGFIHVLFFGFYSSSFAIHTSPTHVSVMLFQGIDHSLKCSSFPHSLTQVSLFSQFTLFFSTDTPPIQANIALPEGIDQSDVQFRWLQKEHDGDGCGCWLLDDVQLISGDQNTTFTFDDGAPIGYVFQYTE